MVQIAATVRSRPAKKKPVRISGSGKQGAFVVDDACKKVDHRELTVERLMKKGLVCEL